MLTRKPGLSLTVTGVRPIRLPSAVRAPTVASEVSAARITSTSLISGTGLKKCSPPIRPRRSQARAMDAIGIEDVFETIRQSGPTAASMFAKHCRFASTSSMIASTTASQGAKPEWSSTTSIREIAAPASALLRWPFSASRSIRAATVLRPASATPLRESRIRVRMPPWAATWMIPCPMVPAPTTPTR